MPVSGAAPNKARRNNLDEKTRQRLIEHLLSGSTAGKLARGDLLNAAKTFKCSRWQVMSVWHLFEQQRADGVGDIKLRNSRGGNSGRKRIDVDKYKELLTDIPLKNRTTQRAVATQLGLSQQTLRNNLKRLGLRAASRFLKPLLTEEGKKKRVDWALRWVRERHGGARASGTGTVLLWYSSYELGVPSGFTTAVGGVLAAVICVGVSASRRAPF